jgi:hypothetical protein
MSDTTPTQLSSLPNIKIPVINPDGTCSLPWYRWFQGLQLASGGSTANLQAEIAAIEAELATVATTAEQALTDAEQALAQAGTLIDPFGMIESGDLDQAGALVDVPLPPPWPEGEAIQQAVPAIWAEDPLPQAAVPPIWDDGQTRVDYDGLLAGLVGLSSLDGSIALVMPSTVFSVSGSPVWDNGTITVTLATQTANTVFAGPASGSAAAPTFRALAAADISGLASIAFQQAGTAEGSAPTLNFATGTVAVSGGVATYTPSGGGGLPSIASGDTLANLTGSSATPTGVTVSAMLDYVFTAAQGDILYRGASTWAVLAPGTSGLYLQTQGASANPQWASASTTLPSINSGDLLGNSTAGAAVASDTTLVALLDRNFSSPGQGAVVYRGASTYAGLGAGTSGQALCTQGASANPHWATPALPSINSGDLLGNSTAGPAAASDTTLTALLDRNFSTPGQGAIIFRGASVYQALGPSSNVGDLLRSGGASANVTWTTPVTTTSGSTTVSALPSASFTGYIRVVSDSTVVPAGNSGATVAGGGSHVCMVWANGSNWIIM